MARQPRLLGALLRLVLLVALREAQASDVYADKFGRVQSLDGSGNNEHKPLRGSVGQNYVFAVGAPDFVDGVSEPRSEAQGLPSARNVSETVLSEGFANSAAGMSDLIAYFGQFVAHDMTHAGRNVSEPLPVKVPRCDATYDPDCTGNGTMAFTRNTASVDEAGHRVPQNSQSTWVDASNVYGVSSETTSKLRTYAGGLLHTSLSPQGSALLPLSADVGISMMQSGIFAAGDRRANAVPQLLCLHTLFHLEHNWRARALAAEHPDWGDEDLFQGARRFVIAMVQHELYNHYLPLLLGRRLPPYDPATGYNDTASPAVDMSFITVAFRYGHSAVQETVMLLDEARRPLKSGHLKLHDVLFNPAEVVANGMENVLRGVLLQPESAIDTFLARDLRESAIIRDLGARGVQRGRERGIPTYNALRRALGLSPATAWSDLTEDVGLQARLRTSYGDDVEGLDSFVGVLTETPEQGMLGPTSHELIARQFERLRSADSFHFERAGVLDDETAAIVAGRSLSDMVLEHTQIQSIADDMFRLQPVYAGEGDDCAGAGSESEAVEVEVLPNQMWFSGTQQSSGGRSEGDPEEVLFSLRCALPNSGGYMAVGIGTLEMMGADTVVATVAASGEVLVTDAFIPSSRGVPVADAELRGDLAGGGDPAGDPAGDAVALAADDVDVLFAEFAGGVLSLSFSRPAQTADVAFDAQLSDLTSVDLIFACGETAGTYHGRANRAALPGWNFAANDGDAMAVRALDSSLERSIYALHGLYMFAVWMVLVPAGTMWVRHFRHVRGAVAGHQSTMQFGALGVFAMAVMAMLPRGGVRTDVLHGILGCVACVWMGVQLALGTWTTRVLAPSASSGTPPPSLGKVIFFKRAHRVSGLLLAVLGADVCFLGVVMYFGGDVLLPQVLFAAYCAVVVAAFYALPWLSGRAGISRSQRKARLGAIGQAPHERGAAAAQHHGKRRTSRSSSLSADPHARPGPGGAWTSTVAPAPAGFATALANSKARRGSKTKVNEGRGAESPATRPAGASAGGGGGGGGGGADAGDLPAWTWDEFAQRAQGLQKMCIVHGKAFDLSSFYESHPAGVRIVEDFLGCDATKAFMGMEPTISDAHNHAHSAQALDLLSGLVVASVPAVGPKRELEWLCYTRMPVLAVQPLGQSRAFLLTLNFMHLEQLRNDKNPVTKQKRKIQNKNQNQNQNQSKDQHLDQHLDRKPKLSDDEDTLADVCAPGLAYELLVVADGRAVSRKYTLWNVEEDGAATFVIRNMAKGKLSPLLAALHTGDYVRVRGPVGKPEKFLDPRSDLPKMCWRKVVLVAGGTGVSIVRSLVRHHLRHAGPDFRMFLLVSERTVGTAVLMGEVEELVEQAEGRLVVAYTFTESKDPFPVGVPRTFRVLNGRVSANHLREMGMDSDRENAAPSGFLAAACGPPALCDHVYDLYNRALHVPTSSIRLYT